MPQFQFGPTPFSASSAAFGNIGGAVSDLFASFGAFAKEKGDLLEGQNYQLAAAYADKEAQYTEWSTAIKQSQQDRELYKSLGQTTADVAGAGFASSGSALDILRESASQGAQARAVLGEQGLITEEGYKEQATPTATWRRRRRSRPKPSTRRASARNGRRRLRAWQAHLECSVR